MKKYLLILLLPLLLGANTISGSLLKGATCGSNATCADTSCTGFEICQNFEGTGYDNSESWTACNNDPVWGEVCSDPVPFTYTRPQQPAITKSIRLIP